MAYGWSPGVWPHRWEAKRCDACVGEGDSPGMMREEGPATPWVFLNLENDARKLQGGEQNRQADGSAEA